MSLATPASVQKLQTALHAKAKEAPGFRFYALYAQRRAGLGLAVCGAARDAKRSHEP
jgi:hypothetical protein